MEELPVTTSPSDSNNPFIPLFISVIDTKPELIVLLYNHVPILFNKAFMTFSNVDSVKEFLREFGSLLNRFVFHDNYFHAGKVTNPDAWTDSLLELPEEERIISMINYRAEPHAFSMTVESPLPEYTILTFKDISQELIQRIMIENDASIDHSSGAYDSEYFLQTSKMFQEAAVVNKKAIAITLIELTDPDVDFIHFVSGIKSYIRQSDMLVRWDTKKFLLAYLIRTPDIVTTMADKLQQKATCTIHVSSAIQKEKEPIANIISRAEMALDEGIRIAD